MSNIYDEANQFAKTLAATPECEHFLSAQRKLKENPDSFQKAKDYLGQQMAIQTRQMLGQQLDDDEIQSFNQLTTTVLAIPEIAEFFQAQMAFGKMFQDIMKTINDAAGFDMDLFGGGLGLH